MADIIWTVLPNGTDAHSYKFSIFVSIRATGTKLSDDFSANWPSQTLGLGNLTLDFFDGTTHTKLPFKVDKTVITTGLWDDLFPGDTLVTPRTFPKNSSRTLVTFPVKEIIDTVHEVYKDTAENFGTDPPPFDVYEDHLVSKVRDFIDQIGDEIATHDQTPSGTQIFFATSTGTVNQGHPALDTDEYKNSSGFYKATRFYRRSLNGGPTPPNAPPKPTVPTVDFHQAMAMLADHPSLLRRLGLIIDGTVDRAGNKVPTTGDTTVSLVAPSLGGSTPATHYTVQGDVFVAKPDTDPTRGTDLELGMLMLGASGRFETHQLDVDGAALKLSDFGANWSNLLLGPLPQNRSAELPSLRTAGIVVSRNDRSTTATTRFTRSESLATDTGGLFADDVTRGYRLDVRRKSDGIWRSLTQRHGIFIVGPSSERVPASGEIHDEGYLKGTAATSDADDSSATKALYLHEVIFGWDGWSPVIKPPGRAMVFDENHKDPNTGQPQREFVQRVENTPATAFKVEPQFKVEPGTLPKLRFGETYQLRARAVDLAGNSLPLSTSVSSTNVVSPEVVYRRYEPIPAPVLVLRSPLVEGESVEHIVIRTESSQGRGLPGNIFFATNDRHIAPPSTSLDLAITHGMLDSLFSNPTASFNIAEKSEGTFLDQEIFDGKGHKKKVPGIEIINSPGVAPGTPASFPSHRGAGLLPGQYVIHSDPKLLLPYLPDPLAIGFALTDGRPTDEQTVALGVHKFVFENDGWPNIEPAKILVQASNGAEPSIDVQKTGIVVQMPQGTILDLIMTSIIPSSALNQLAIWALMDPGKQATLQTAVLDGLHWMITARRQIKVVHAVERPLVAAKFTDIKVAPDRAAGETFVKLKTEVDNHSHSTGQIDFEASWSDRVDRLSDAGPTDEPHTAHVFTFEPDYAESLAQVPSLKFLDDGHRPKHDFGDTKHRFVDYRPDATTRYREYFPASVTSDPSNLKLAGIPTEVNILASARPKAPAVLYVVPTFKWESDGEPGGPGNSHPPTQLTSKRVGRGLRVYLSRPWFSSGDGELLGVIIPGQSGSDDTSRKYISEWGADPIWKGSDPPEPNTAIAATDFTSAAVVSGDDLVLSEDSSVKVQCVAFDVEYNADRRVWFADIEMGDVASYTPFIRLGLARYQPDSITNAELSPVVKAEFAQLVNDRTAALVFGDTSIQVTVSGIAAHNRLGDEIAPLLTAPSPVPSAPPGFTLDVTAGAGRIVTAQVEQRGPGHSDLEWDPAGDPVVLASFASATPGSLEVLWTGSVPNPAKTPASFAHRLVIRETELFPTDADVSETVSVPLPDGRQARGRVVYLDVIQFDGTLF